MAEEETKLNIHQKLIEVRKTVSYLKKDNQGYQFKFVSSSQTLGAVRGAMDEQGLLLIPSVTGKETRDHNTKDGSHEYFTILDMCFTWVNADNPEDRVECSWTGQGLDAGEKGVGKALTYAEKYFILKFFNIATDKDDPDAFQERTVHSDAPTTQQTGSQAGKSGAPPPIHPPITEATPHFCQVHNCRFYENSPGRWSHKIAGSNPSQYCNEDSGKKIFGPDDVRDIQLCEKCRTTWGILSEQNGKMVCENCVE